MWFGLAMRGDEQRVVDVFTAWLHGQGWSTQHEVNFVDILAERAGRRMYVEAKGRTAAPGLDVDTMFGQLLRRMPPDELGSVDFAVVVPDVAIRFVLRVPKRVRDVLRIRAFSVAEDGTVIEATN